MLELTIAEFLGAITALAGFVYLALRYHASNAAGMQNIAQDRRNEVGPFDKRKAGTIL